MPQHWLQKAASLSILVLFNLVWLPAYAQVVSQTIPNTNLKAEAEYIVGNSDKPAVLILHGFLTTNQFHTIVSVAQNLQLEGYTTLAPTLTLNISQRRTSVKCNAIHTHTMESDLNEIQAWIDFLKKQGHQKIVLLGHSSGSQTILEYLHTREEKEISLAIFTSLFHLSGAELGTYEEDIKKAKNAVANRENRPQKYSFLFCNQNYFATPESFLSYVRMDRQYTLAALSKIKTPSYTIMGGEDKRYQKVGREWLSDLKSTKTQLIVIPGANHFFSSEYEFDLQDTLTRILRPL